MKRQISAPTQLVPEFRDWLLRARPEDQRVWNYLSQTTKIGLAALFGTLFWPEFVEVRGCVLLRERYDEKNFEQWWSYFGGDCARIEQVINHVHLYDLFPSNSGSENDLPRYEYVAQILRLGWEADLQMAFPTKHVEVSSATEPEDYGPTISFWQVANPMRPTDRNGGGPANRTTPARSDHTSPSPSAPSVDREV